MRGFADQVAARWREPDAGIWEIRGDAAHHVHSKLMAWLALDRALRIAATHRTPARQRAPMADRSATPSPPTSPPRASTPAIGSYTRTYGSTDLDAAVLVLPLLGIEPADSPRVRGTIDAIARRARRRRAAPVPLPARPRRPPRHRRRLPAVLVLARPGARRHRPHRRSRTSCFDELVALASPLGLYAEEMDPATDAHLGNYPQALTHAALVQAALVPRPRA